MTIEQAIEHAEEVADEKFKNAEFIKNNPYGDKSKIQGCVECAEEHRQLAAWLRELQERRKEPTIPVAWIEKYIEWLKSLDNEFAKLAAAHISVMVKKWRDEQNETARVD